MLDKNKNLQILLFFIFTIFILISQIFFNDWKFYYDSLDYWNRANEFIKNNEFSLLNYNEPLRGYLYPLLLFIIKEIAKIISVSDVLLFYIFYSIFISLNITFIIPNLAEKLFNITTKVHQIIIFFIIFYLFWNGYFNYPLTDVISIFFIFISLSFFLKFNIDNKVTTFYLIFSGMFLFAAAQLRPIYLILIIAIFILLLLLFILKKSLKGKLILTSFGLIIGFLIVATPQIYININLYRTFNPLAETSKSKITGGSNLYVYQLRGGIRVQKYETFIGTNYFDSAHAGFLDNKIQGQQLYDELRAAKNTNFYNIAKIIAFNIGDFVMIYSRHFFNGLDIWYNTPYVKNLFTPTRYILSFINYTLFFCVFVFIIKNKSIIQNKQLSFGLLLYLTPIAFVIPTIIEVRFFLPLFILVYVMFSYLDVINFLRQNLKSLIREYWYKYLIFILVCFILSQYTFSLLTFN
jgi:hypothetical protein